MKKLIKLAAMTFFLSVPLPVMSHLAHAQQTLCGKRADLIAPLTKSYKEKSTSLGITTGSNSVLEVFQSPGGKTWTILITQPNGKSCLLFSGFDWTDSEPEKEGAPL